MSIKTKGIAIVCGIGLLVGGVLLVKSDQGKGGVKVGAVYGLTGNYAGIGEQFKNGLLLAAKEINKQGGINGKEVEVVIEDSRSDVPTAIAALRKLIDVDGVKYLSTFGSSVALTMKPILEEKKILGFLDATHPKITEGSGSIIRHSNVATADAAVIARAIKEADVKRVGNIYVNDDYGTVLNGTLQKELTGMGIEYKAESHGTKDTDFKTQISKILNGKPDAVVVASFGPSTGLIIRQLREQGFKGEIFNNIGLVLTPDAQKIAGPYAKGVHYETYVETPQEFIDLYRKEYGKDPGVFAVYTYLDLELLEHAIEKVGDDPVKVAEFIKGMGEFKGRFETAQIDKNGDIIIPTVMKVWE